MRAEELAMLVNGLDVKQTQQRRLVSQERVKKLWNIFANSRNMGHPLMAVARSTETQIATLERELRMGTRSPIEKRNAQIRLLEERLRQRRIQLLGPHSETLSDLQLELLAEEEPSATREEVEAEARREPMPDKAAAERKPHPGRQAAAGNLPRIEEVIACAEANCKTCGGETSVIGYDESEVLDGSPRAGSCV